MQRSRFLALILLLTGLSASSSTAMVQTGAPAPATAPDSGRRTLDPVGRLLEKRDELKLTDTQAARLEAIRAKYLEKHQAHIEDLRRSREARAALRAGMDSTRTEVMAVLTPEQQKQVGAMRKKWWKEHARHHHGERHGERDGKHDDHEDDDHDT
jgi:Spy/CpxP family protein refolding chaperone